jgi:hypothetical protein
MIPGRGRILLFILVSKCDIHIEIKSRLNLGNACHFLVQNLLSSYVLPKNLKNKTYRIVILSVVLYRCEIWSLMLREENSTYY